MWSYFKKSTKNVFESIYTNNGFKGKDSISGPGSDIEQTKVIRTYIPRLISKLYVKNILDIPCGDFYWMKLVDLSPSNYIGGDIVKDLIKNNNQIYGKEKIKFSVIDLLKDPLPHSELLICRDCLVHLSYKDIQKAINNIKNSSIEYLLTTTFSERKENSDIQTGQWRPLNLRLYPFNFPEPLELLNENCTENDSLYTDKSLGLWKICDLPNY